MFANTSASWDVRCVSGKRRCGKRRRSRSRYFHLHVRSHIRKDRFVVCTSSNCVHRQSLYVRAIMCSAGRQKEKEKEKEREERSECGVGAKEKASRGNVAERFGFSALPVAPGLVETMTPADAFGRFRADVQPACRPAVGMVARRST